MPAHEFAVFGVEGDGAAGGDVAFQDLAGDERFGAALQVAAERACAVEGVVATVYYEALGGFSGRRP